MLPSHRLLVWEFYAPEVARWVEHFDAELKKPVLGGGADLNDAKFATLLGKSVAKFNARSQFRGKRNAKQRARATYGDGFGGAIMLCARVCIVR
jgi:hypothetical protein